MTRTASFLGRFPTLGRWAAVAVLVSLCGCGAGDEFKRTAIEGTVTVDGNPLPYGMITLEGPKAENGHSTKCIVEVRDGKFTALAAGGPTPGDNQVYVTMYRGAAPPPPPPGEDPPRPRVAGYWKGAATVESGKPVEIKIVKEQFANEEGEVIGKELPTE